MKFGDNYLTSLLFDITSQSEKICAISEDVDKEEVKWTNLESRGAKDNAVFAQQEVFRASHTKLCQTKDVLGKLEEELPFSELVDYH